MDNEQGTEQESAGRRLSSAARALGGMLALMGDDSMIKLLETVDTKPFSKLIADLQARAEEAGEEMSPALAALVSVRPQILEMEALGDRGSVITKLQVIVMMRNVLSQAKELRDAIVRLAQELCSITTTDQEMVTAMQLLEETVNGGIVPLLTDQFAMLVPTNAETMEHINAQRQAELEVRTRCEAMLDVAGGDVDTARQLYLMEEQLDLEIDPVAVKARLAKLREDANGDARCARLLYAMEYFAEKMQRERGDKAGAKPDGVDAPDGSSGAQAPAADENVTPDPTAPDNAGG